MFFDYFPGDAERMGMRPEERQALLQDELFAARVQRKTLATDLADRLHVPLEAVELPETLRKTLRDQLLGGRTLEQAVQDRVWEEIDEDLRVADWRQVTASSAARRICERALTARWCSVRSSPPRRARVRGSAMAATASSSSTPGSSPAVVPSPR
ncbi:hypothetical protein ONA70_20565 [Micromonospora yasonensis]|uniref:hypothetical protein n=1 Tax=Micromonospora yasonensis TaxID=1128667 RepID=UPI0022325B4D|nr:hypothetical protein [Micromonospora yasonensis]MCW3842495.1 hypothetical protein [Micromonospora yasonensis]